MKTIDFASLREHNVKHEAQETALSGLLASIAMATLNHRITCLVGHAGVGKGRLAQLLIQKLTQQLAEPPIYVIAAPEVGSRSFSMLQLLRLILVALGDPQPTKHSIGRGQIPPALLQLTNLTGARTLVAVRNRLLAWPRPALIIDEASYISQGTPRQVTANMRGLTWLAEHIAVPIVLIGTYDVLALPRVGPDVNRRLRIVDFPRYPATTTGARAFARAVRGFEAHLLGHGLASANCLTGKEQLRDLHAGSEGCIGVLSDWIWIALHLAGTRGRKLTFADLRESQSWVLADRVAFRKTLHDGEEAVVLAGHASPYAKKKTGTDGTTTARSGESGDDQGAPPVDELIGVTTEPIERKPPVGVAKLKDMSAFWPPEVAGA
jgi:hypothetical protein